MKMLRTAIAVSIIVAYACCASAQTMLNYVDPSVDSHRSRRQTENSGAGANSYTNVGSNARPTPTPKASPSPNGKSGTSGKSMTSTKAGSTSGTASAKGLPAAGKAGAAKGAAAAGGGFEQTGKLQQVTKAMVESIRTHKVDFDEDAASKDPAIILLNPRMLTAPEEQGAKTDSLAHPL